MAFQSLTVTADLDIITALEQLNENNIANEALRTKMQGGLIAYKKWDDNQISPSGLDTTYQCTSGAIESLPPLELSFSVEETGYYRIVLCVAHSYTTTSSTCTIAVGDNAIPPDTSVYSAYFWGVNRYPAGAYSSTLGYPSIILYIDRWLQGGKTYNITGLAFGTSGDGKILRIMARNFTGVYTSTCIYVHYAGAGVP